MHTKLIDFVSLNLGSRVIKKKKKEQSLRRILKRFRGGLVFQARRLWYHSTLGLRVIKKKMLIGEGKCRVTDGGEGVEGGKGARAKSDSLSLARRARNLLARARPIVVDAPQAWHNAAAHIQL